MKTRTISKLIVVLLFGLLYGGAIHYHHVKGGQLGREGFLAKQAVRFDNFYAKPPSIAFEMFIGVVMAGCGFGAYELVVFGLSKILKKTDEDGA